MSNYELGTVAIATVKNVANVTVLRTESTLGKPGWAFAPVSELGLVTNFARDFDVRDIRVIETPEVHPVRADYDIANMTPKQIEEALIDILGEGEGPDEDYYDEFTGINAFYHTLAGTSYPDHVKLPENIETGTGKKKGLGAVAVPHLGDFVAVDKVTEYMAETGDADSFVVFEFAGKTYKKHAYLDSYEGGVWDGSLTEVKPVEKTITVWEKI